MQTNKCAALIPTNCIGIYMLRYPVGWCAADYDHRGYASNGRYFADKQGARRHAQWLAKLYRKRIVELD